MSNSVLAALNQEFLRVHPNDSSRVLEQLDVEEAAALLAAQPVDIGSQVLEKLTPSSAEAVITHLEPALLGKLFTTLNITRAVSLLSRLDGQARASILGQLGPELRSELESMLEYPENTAGRQMNPRVAVFKESTTVGEALRQLMASRLQSTRKLYLVDEDLRLQAQVEGAGGHPQSAVCRYRCHTRRPVPSGDPVRAGS